MTGRAVRQRAGPSSALIATPRRRALAVGGAALLLAGCGFQLRRAPEFSFERLALEGFAPRSPMAEALRRELPPGVRVVDAAAAQVVLQARTEGREKVVVASTSAGQVREVQLRVRLRFAARTPSGRELLAPVEIALSRDISTSESAALAKESEEAELYRVMESDLAVQAMRRLATIRL